MRCVGRRWCSWRRGRDILWRMPAALKPISTTSWPPSKWSMSTLKHSSSSAENARASRRLGRDSSSQCPTGKQTISKQCMVPNHPLESSKSDPKTSPPITEPFILNGLRRRSRKVSRRFRRSQKKSSRRVELLPIHGRRVQRRRERESRRKEFKMRPLPMQESGIKRDIGWESRNSGIRSFRTLRIWNLKSSMRIGSIVEGWRSRHGFKRS